MSQCVSLHFCKAIAYMHVYQMEFTFEHDRPTICSYASYAHQAVPFFMWKHYGARSMSKFVIVQRLNFRIWNQTHTHIITHSFSLNPFRKLKMNNFKWLMHFSLPPSFLLYMYLDYTLLNISCDLCRTLNTLFFSRYLNPFESQWPKTISMNSYRFAHTVD